MTKVRSHERSKPRKSDAWIKPHAALLTDPEESRAFASRYGVEIPDSSEQDRKSVVERFMPLFRRRA